MTRLQTLIPFLLSHLHPCNFGPTTTMKALAEAEIKGILAVLEMMPDGVVNNATLDVAATAMGSGKGSFGGKITLPLRFNGKVVGLTG